MLLRSGISLWLVWGRNHGEEEWKWLFGVSYRVASKVLLSKKKS